MALTLTLQREDFEFFTLENSWTSQNPIKSCYRCQNGSILGWDALTIYVNLKRKHNTTIFTLSTDSYDGKISRYARVESKIYGWSH